MKSRVQNTYTRTESKDTDFVPSSTAAPPIHQSIINTRGRNPGNAASKAAAEPYQKMENLTQKLA